MHTSSVKVNSFFFHFFIFSFNKYNYETCVLFGIYLFGNNQHFGEYTKLLYFICVIIWTAV